MLGQASRHAPSTREARTRTLRAGRAFKAIGIGIAVAAASRSAALREARPWFGIPRDRITAMSGLVTGQPSPAKSGGTVIRMSIDEVRGGPAAQGGSAAGARQVWKGGARLRVAVLVRSGTGAACRVPSEGERLVLRAPPPEEGDLIFVDGDGVESLGFDSPARSFLARARAGFRNAGARSPFSGSGLLVALMTGDRSLLSREESESFKKAGCLHILALSGQHIGMLVSLLALALKPLAGKKAALALSALAACAYLAVTGVQPSMLRAVLSFCLACAAWALGAHASGPDLLGLAFLVAASVLPGDRTEASFILSYAATAGIVLLRPSIARHLTRWLPPKAANQFAIGIAASAGAMPASIVLFGTAAPVSIPLSVATGPFVELLMWGGCAFAPVAAAVPSPGFHRFLGRILDVPYRILAALLRLGARAPSADVPPGAARAAAASVLALAFVALYAWRKHGYPGLRLAPRAQGISRGTRPRDEQALRPELPRQRGGPRADRGGHSA